MIRRAARPQSLLLFVLVLVGACKLEPNPPRAARSAADAAREAIGEARARYVQAHLDGDADRVASLFAPDAMLIREDAAELISARDIRDDYRTFFNDTGLSAYQLTTESVDIASGGIAYELGTLDAQKRPTDLPIAGRYVIRWRRGPEASWRIERMLITDRDRVPADSAGATKTGT